MKNDFLLKGRTAKKLYKFAAKLPVIDFHNHLSVTDIADNKRFTDIYELWIKPDPYKHRAMRMCGVSEYYITGEASEQEKFEAWWKTLPRLAGNPLYLWSKMELSYIFGIKKPIENFSGAEAYSLLNNYLSKENVTAQSLLRKFGAVSIAPCTSLVDQLDAFEESELMVPSLRGDDILRPTGQFIEKLEELTGILVDSLEAFEKAVRIRLDCFFEKGCRFTDYALDNGFKYFSDDGKNPQRFDSLKSGTIEAEDGDRLASYLLTFLNREHAKKGFTVQLHIGAVRRTSSKLLEKAGPAGGFAAIGNSVDIASLTTFFDAVDKGEYGLPKTVIYTLNPADNALFSVLSGSYSKDGVAGVITQGSAWWWCDHANGIEEMLDKTMSYSVFSNFLGMTTDSRSLLSFVRHDYFRRILCTKVAEKAQTGEFPSDIKSLEKIIYNICYKNAKEMVGGN